MLLGAARAAPAELTADFQRFYGIPNWKTLPPSHAADLCAAMITQPESWTHRALNPHWQWAYLHNQWGVRVADALAWLQWAKTKDGQKNRNLPKPFPRPTFGEKKSSYVGLPLDELKELLAAPRQSR
ncbi:DUF5361 domain-containing protein [Schaalia sp. lx-260]|uniref:DUF5361 domain-containing protein n=1 Tax=Schaalia sp. lx-260 TaxID=2899082 RepID=UPI001E2B790B|nr:DUF5361 domain-containing protein [Schaalia sp. lx-260]MCD4549674.1 DUF5361 domain-containing protein [Schaalia sp. lx-260]